MLDQPEFYVGLAYRSNVKFLTWEGQSCLLSFITKKEKEKKKVFAKLHACKNVSGWG